MSEPALKETPIIDISTPYQKRKALLALYGILIILGTAFLGTWFTAILIAPNMAIYGGLSCVMVVGGFLGYFTVIVQGAVQEVIIKVTKE
jgi:hypothetical protein